MSRRTFLLLMLLTPIITRAQIYKFNRQSMIYFEDEHRSKTDTWHTPIIVEVTNKYVVLRRPPTEAGEKEKVDSLEIKSNSKERRDKRDNFTKLKVKDGRVLIIYGDDYMTMCTKETKEHKRTEYVFYNQK